jgi:Skp family chaperone for outer membrane proteins
MIHTLKIAALSGAALIAALSPAMASAQVVIIDKDAAVQGSAALQGAVAQIKVTYAATLGQWEARGKQLDAALKPQIDAFQAAQKVPNPNRVTLQSQYSAIQAKQQEGAAELQRIFAPVQRAQDYALSQIGTHLESALKAVMTKRGASIVLVPQATVSYQPAADATKDLTDQLNVEVPSVSTAVPAGWTPGQPAAGATAPAATAKPTTGGR